MGDKKVTIDHVAAKAGVSKTTVSRYLNERFDLISDATRKKIDEVVKELDYHPNRMAQGLKSRSSRIIGCIVSDIGSPFSSILVKGINSICVERGYEVLLIDSEDNPDKELQAIRSLVENQVDGIIVNSTGQNEEMILEYAKQLPIVLADRALSIEGVLDTVCTDNYNATCKCMKYLKNLGYAKVAFFTEKIGKIMPRILRHKGFMDSMRDVFECDGSTLVYEYRDKDDCLEKVRSFVTSYPDERVAIFAVNGVVLLEVLNAAKKAGLRMGKNFGVCGYDNWGWADLIGPGITTITQDSWNVGAKTAELLMNRINGTGPEKPVYIELESLLELRGSTVSGD